MSADFTFEFAGNYIRMQLPVDYEITPENRRQFWVAIGEACNKYNCCRVLAESPTPPKRNMRQTDSLKSALEAAKVPGELRVAFFFKGYTTDKTTEFFINVSYNMGVRIEFFADSEEAIKWLTLDDEHVT